MFFNSFGYTYIFFSICVHINLKAVCVAHWIRALPEISKESPNPCIVYFFYRCHLIYHACSCFTQLNNDYSIDMYVFFHSWHHKEPVLIPSFYSIKQIGDIHPQNRILVYSWILSIATLSTHSLLGGEGDKRFSAQPTQGPLQRFQGESWSTEHCRSPWYWYECKLKNNT